MQAFFALFLQHLPRSVGQSLGLQPEPRTEADLGDEDYELFAETSV